MKVDKIIPSMVEKTSVGRINNVKKVADNSIKEFNDRVGELTGRTKVAIDSAKEITKQEFAKIKEELRKKMVARNFSDNNIDYILSYTGEHNYQVTQAFVDDMYAHTSTITWAVPYTTKGNAHLMKDAVLKKNYDAVYRIEDGQITDVSQIKDMRKEVIENGRKYEPIKKTTLAINHSQYIKERRAILDELK